jgi:hypothetical protein
MNLEAENPDPLHASPQELVIASDSAPRRSPNEGLTDLLLACPYPFEVPPRQKDFSRNIDLGK